MLWIITSWAIFVIALAWPAWFIAHRLRRRRQYRVRCESCCYDLRGTVTTCCPECGHDFTQPMRLIRVRRLLLHAMIIVVLLTASHLVYRIDAIGKRGWIAAVPTTVLIVCLPYQGSDTSDYGSFMWRLADELALRRSGFLHDYDHAMRVPSDELAEWQRRWIIHKAVNIDFGPDVPLSNWRFCAEGIIREEQENLSPAQIDHLRSCWYFQVDSRPVWPRDAVVFARFRYDALGLDDCRFRAVPLNTRYNAFDERLSENVVPLGIAREQGPVEYDLVFERLDTESGDWRTVGRERVTVTTISESTAPDLSAVTLSDAFLESLSPMLDPNLGPFGGFGIWLDFGSGQTLRQSMGDGMFALSITLLCDGERIGWSRDRWDIAKEWGSGSSNKSDPRRHVDTQPILASSIQSIGQIDSHIWTVRIEGDPLLTLQDFDAASYWDGKYEFKNIRVERESKP